MITEIKEAITKYSISNSTPGFAFLVKQSDTTVHEEYMGYRNPAHDLIDQDSKFRIASITKQFTAAAILKIIEDNKLRLDTPINTILDLGSYADSVTIQHMLTHTSGLPDYEEIVQENNETPFTDLDVHRVMCEVSKLEFEAGTAYHYSNTAYCLLAIVIQKLTGMSYKEYLEAYIFPSAGMLKSSVGPSLEHDRVYGYTQSAGSWTLHDQSKFSTTQGDGGIYASAIDLMKWQQHLYKNKNIISTKSLELMTKPYVQTNYAGESYGFGIAITIIDGDLCYLHHGTSSGFENALFYLPKYDVSMTILANFSGTGFNTITLGKQFLLHHISEFKST